MFDICYLRLNELLLKDNKIYHKKKSILLTSKPILFITDQLKLIIFLFAVKNSSFFCFSAHTTLLLPFYIIFLYSLILCIKYKYLPQYEHFLAMKNHIHFTSFMVVNIYLKAKSFDYVIMGRSEITNQLRKK